MESVSRRVVYAAKTQALFVPEEDLLFYKAAFGGKKVSSLGVVDRERTNKN
jgi:hypothetical protein